MPIAALQGNNEAFELALHEGLRVSRTALLIWRYLQTPGRDFDVVTLGANEMFGQMLMDADRAGEDAVRGQQKYREMNGLDKADPMPRPAVLWNPKWNFEYFGDCKGVTVNARGDVIEAKSEYVYKVKKKGLQQSFNVIRVTKSVMPPWVVLFHELGHMKQYFEGGSASAWEARLPDSAGIEEDNLERHERPICREIGLPVRAHYKHNVFGFADVKQRYGGGSKASAWVEANSVQDRLLKETEIASQATTHQQAPGDGFHFA